MTKKASNPLPTYPKPTPPPAPPSRVITEGGGCGFCPKCKSTMHREKFFFFGKKICDQVLCGFKI